MGAIDQDYQLTGIQAANGATTVQNLTNGFDPSGNINSITYQLASSRGQTFAMPATRLLSP